MADEDNNNENTKVSVGLRLDGELYGAILTVANMEDRSVANTITRMLKQTPQIQDILEAEPATAGAGN